MQFRLCCWDLFFNATILSYFAEMAVLVYIWKVNWITTIWHNFGWVWMVSDMLKLFKYMLKNQKLKEGVTVSNLTKNGLGNT